MPAPPRRRLLVAGAILTLLVAGGSAAVSSPAAAAGPLISQGKPATASSEENAGTPASAAFDGNAGTRWSSAFTDPQWIQVDLGGTAAVDQVELVWETAAARAFQIQVSAAAGGPWTTIYSTTTGAGGTQTLALSGSGRYVRMNGTARTTGYGYSLWEFQVFGTVDTSSSTPPLLSGPTRPPATTGQFALTGPADAAMVTTTRRPALS
ncbi:MAG TPA: discoidin domain-containing protein, partial [Asanoa sp.]|nr:discoidin domain-containing protein [Asanoa sp.]